MYEVPAALGTLLAGCPQLLAAWHYGSSLRSDYRPGISDIDILLIVRDDTTLEQYAALSAGVHMCVPSAEVTVLRHAEVTAGIHPGWSRHYFVNVARSGRHLYGPDLVALAAAAPLSLDDAYQRIVELTQRARLVCVNPSKKSEEIFWLRKYQHWIPLCMMELLELAGSPEDRLQCAQQSFLARFPSFRTRVAFPYVSLTQVTDLLEQLIRWVPANAAVFAEARPPGASRA
ncbi:MAG TPA: nucleotidyltransferase domain-containing protein [Actinoplanes sp.]|jgi:hypothetical protein